MRIVAIIIQPPRLLDAVPGLLSNRTVAWSESCRSRSWSIATSTVASRVTSQCIGVAAVSPPDRCQTAMRDRMWSAVETGGCRAPPVGFARAPVGASVGAGPQPVEHLAGVRHDEGVGIGLERGDVDGGRVEVVEVDRVYDVLGDPGGEGDGDAVALAVYGVPGALTAQVGAVRE